MHPNSLALMVLGELAGWEVVLLSCTATLCDGSEDPSPLCPCTYQAFESGLSGQSPLQLLAEKDSPPQHPSAGSVTLFPGSSCEGGIAISS